MRAHDIKNHAAHSDLSSIDDPIVRAVLDPEGCAWEDFKAAELAGLVHLEPAGVLPDGIEMDEQRCLTELGDSLKDQAQRIADGLSDDDAAILDGTRAAFYLSDATSLVAKGLLRAGTPVPFSRFKYTSLGILVLAIRERSKTATKVKLSDITDDQRRALLDPDGCAPHEWIALVKAGLGRVTWSEPDDRNMCSHTRSRSDEGDRLLAEAQLVADALSDVDVADMNAAHAMIWDDRGSWDPTPFERRGLLRPAMTGGMVPVGEVTPAGLLALELRSRKAAAP